MVNIKQKLKQGPLVFKEVEYEKAKTGKRMEK